MLHSRWATASPASRPALIGRRPVPVELKVAANEHTAVSAPAAMHCAILVSRLHRSRPRTALSTRAIRVELRDGRYHFMGRAGGVINVGGLKVHPEEVEAVINAIPWVRMSLVEGTSQPHHRRGSDGGESFWRTLTEVCRASARKRDVDSRDPRGLPSRRYPRTRYRLWCESSPRWKYRLPANWCAPVLNVIVTGGSRGLGLAISTTLAAAGYRVIAVARSGDGRSCARCGYGRERANSVARYGFGASISVLASGAIAASGQRAAQGIRAALWAHQQRRYRHAGRANHHAGRADRESTQIEYALADHFSASMSCA